VSPGVLEKRLLAVVLGASCALAPRLSHADTTFNFLAASEFGRGLGAGFEVGSRDVFVAGVGSGFGIGYSSVQGVVGQLDPGVALGYRRYLGDWFVGPSVGFNVMHAVSTEERDRASELGSLLLDLGYRWRWSAPSKWQTRLGLSPGVAMAPDGAAHFSAALTLSFGVRL